MKRLLIIITLATTLTTGIPASAAIQFNNQIQVAPFAASSTQQLGGLIKDFSLTDANSVTSVGAGMQIVASIGSFFVGVNDWLKDKAGIDLFAIFKTIGHWFVIIVQWLIDIIKKVL